MEPPLPRPARPAFTLVEILIVVVILGILAAIVVPRFAGATDEAKMGTFIASLRTYADACEYFAVKEGYYPPDGDGDLESGLFQEIAGDRFYYIIAY